MRTPDESGSCWRFGRPDSISSRLSEPGRAGEADSDQLGFAVSEGRALYTANKADFARLHSSYMAAGRPHAGIVICTWQEMPPERQARRLLDLIESSGLGSLENQCLYVGPVTFWTELGN